MAMHDSNFIRQLTVGLFCGARGQTARRLDSHCDGAYELALQSELYGSVNLTFRVSTSAQAAQTAITKLCRYNALFLRLYRPGKPLWASTIGL